MDDRHLTNAQLDEAIDQVAREMMDRDTDTAFRARLMERLEAPQSGERHFGRLAWAGGLAVLVLALGTGLWLLKHTQPTEQSASAGRPGSSQAGVAARQPGQSQVAASQTATVAQRLAEAGTSRARSGAGMATRSTNGARPGADITQSAAEPPVDRGPAPLSGPSPIEMESIAPGEIPIRDIGIAPIPEIAPITIPPAATGSGEPQGRELR